MPKNEWVLRYALDHLEHEAGVIQAKINAIRSELGESRATAVAAMAATMPGPKKGQKRKLSPEARARIAAAQKKRWADYKKKAVKKK